MNKIKVINNYKAILEIIHLLDKEQFVKDRYLDSKISELYKNLNEELDAINFVQPN